ncbi:hypothetical protein LCGC14_2034020 [marine sediment metagenome]|uniref:Uncharacterized protein n=1 Tax=marine sediment metagenome TaxID=412755 RepID=A0A0F9FGD9_9ZZZZ
MPKYERAVQVVKATVHLFAINCCRCGVTFGLDSEYEAERRRDHLIWYCPNGHGQSWSQDNEEEKAKRLLAEERTRLVLVRTERDQAVQDLMNQAKEIKRHRRRAQAGVCSQCHRTFSSVARHMATKHPEVGKHPEPIPVSS